MTEQQHPFESWCIVELMGHRRLAGMVREITLAGAGMLRCDVPGEGEEIIATSIFPAASLYNLTPCTEAVARTEARLCRPCPVQQLDVPALPYGARQTGWQDDSGGEDDEEECDDRLEF